MKRTKKLFKLRLTWLIITVSLNVYLNNRGKEGWELVQVLTKKMIHDSTTVASYTFIFKRQKN